MGHKRIDETMLYVHVAEAHHRELPEVVRLAAMNETDPDTRILRTRSTECERGDSLPHTVKYRNLNPACLPIPPRSQWGVARGSGGPPQLTSGHQLGVVD